MRADRPSFTAQLVSGTRALYATFPPELQIAPDPDAGALAPPVLALSARALSAVPALAPLVHHALGAASLGMSWHVALRTLAIDAAAREALSAGATQMVLLGAGLDNRAGRLASRIRTFEVDHPDMQRYKRARLKAAGVRDHRVLVPVNFEVDRLATSLEGAGFSRQAPTLWIWESVTPYLTHAAVESTLGAVCELSARGSRLAITYTRPAAVFGPRFHRLATFLAKVVGERLHSTYDRGDMESLLGKMGFRVLSDESDIDIADRYWKDPPAAHPRSIRLFPEWERLAVAERLQA